MNSKNNSNINGLPKLKKKSMLQQVMKPRDWASLAILIAVSAVCWMWVLSAYSQPIDVETIIINSSASKTIDNNVVL